MRNRYRLAPPLHWRRPVSYSIGFGSIPTSCKPFGPRSMKSWSSSKISNDVHRARSNWLPKAPKAGFCGRMLAMRSDGTRRRCLTSIKRSAWLPRTAGFIGCVPRPGKRWGSPKNRKPIWRRLWNSRPKLQPLKERRGTVRRNEWLPGVSLPLTPGKPLARDYWFISIASSQCS